MAEELVRQTAQLPNVSVKGLMAIPPVGSGEDVFEKMHGIFLSVKEKGYTERVYGYSLNGNVWGL